MAFEPRDRLMIHQQMMRAVRTCGVVVNEENSRGQKVFQAMEQLENAIVDYHTAEEAARPPKTDVQKAAEKGFNEG